MRDGNIGVAILVRGKRLYLRATFPPKPGSKKEKWHQQDLALGSYANPQGIKRAEAEAKKVGGLIALNQFDWEPYLRRKRLAPAQTISEWVEKYKQDYFNRHGYTPKSQSSWTKNCWTYLKRLPANEPLTDQCLLKAINKTTANTASRAKICQAFQQLVKFSGLPTMINFKNLAGKYEPEKRNLPSDQEILDWYYKITSLEDRRIYALLATCGFRPHEIFHLDFSDFQKGKDYIKVLHDTKTGERVAFPLYPAWLDEFNLREVRLLEFNTEGKSNGELGERIGVMFRRYKIPFKPYDLRHCWARRSIECGMDVRKSADSMGHSIETHHEVYNKWLKEADSQRAFDSLKQNHNLPKAPTQRTQIEPSRIRTEIQQLSLFFTSL